jgi:hypothetical protein
MPGKKIASFRGRRPRDEAFRQLGNLVNQVESTF